jgi:hypothetical protein
MRAEKTSESCDTMRASSVVVVSLEEESLVSARCVRRSASVPGSGSDGWF